jgi:hypothetical protein
MVGGHKRVGDPLRRRPAAGATARPWGHGGSAVARSMRHRVHWQRDLPPRSRRWLPTGDTDRHPHRDQPARSAPHGLRQHFWQ